MAGVSSRPRATVSLVLGSGGARGMAHIGVIRWLVEHNFKIRAISGASIGALVGGVYACGKLDEFETWVKSISKPTMLTLMDLSWGRGGLVKGDRFLEVLSQFAHSTPIENLPIAFTAVAAELSSGKEVWLRSGDLLLAIRASISLPLLFTPMELDGELLIDGGVLNPVPIAPTFGDASDLTIAVSLNGTPDIGGVPDLPKSPEATDAESIAVPAEIAQWFDRIQSFIWPEEGGAANGDAAGQSKAESKSGGTEGGDEDSRSWRALAAKSVRRDWSAYEVAYLAFDAMQGTISRQKLAAYPPDHLVEISRSACRTLEFDRAQELISAGYRQADQSLSDLL